MIADKTIAVVVVAAGKGLRMGAGTPKQYMELGTDTVLGHTLAAFEKSCADAVVLVCPQGDAGYVRSKIVADRFPKVRAVAEGGRERFDSCYAGIRAAKELFGGTGPDLLMIHDGVRPLVTPELIENVAEALLTHPAVCPGVKVKDTVRVTNGSGMATSAPAREGMYLIQTPQGFETGLITLAYRRFFDEAAHGTPEGITDDAMLVERYTDTPVFVSEGSYENIKITTPEDLLFAQALLARR